MKTLSISDVLLDASNAIETYGHLKYDVGNEDRGFCIQGAIAYAVAGSTEDWEIYETQEYEKAMLAVHRVITNNGPVDVMHGPTGEVCQWNNAHERTAEEAIAALRAAA